MKIPPKYHLFDPMPSVTLADQARLEPHLSCWARLVELLFLRVSDDDLRRLIVFELMGKRRRPILNRLLGALMKAERRTLDEKIGRIVS